MGAVQGCCGWSDAATFWVPGAAPGGAHTRLSWRVAAAPKHPTAGLPCSLGGKGSAEAPRALVCSPPGGQTWPRISPRIVYTQGTSGRDFNQHYEHSACHTPARGLSDLPKAGLHISHSLTQGEMRPQFPPQSWWFSHKTVAFITQFSPQSTNHLCVMNGHSVAVE